MLRILRKIHQSPILLRTKRRNERILTRKFIDDEEPNGLQTIKPPPPFSPLLGLPITRRPLFPGFYKTVVIHDQSMIKVVREVVKAEQPYVGAVLLKDDESQMDIIKSLDDVHKVGVFSQIVSVHPMETSQTIASIIDKTQGPLTVVLCPLQRIQITGLGSKEQSPHSFLGVDLLENTAIFDKKYDRENQVIRALTSEIVAALKDIASLNPIFRDQVSAFSMTQMSSTIFDSPARLADFAAAMSGAGTSSELQQVLETQDIEERLRLSLYVLKKELVNAKLQAKLSKDIESKIQKRQQEYYLLEQLRAIKKELGMDAGDGGRDRVLENFKERIVKLGGMEKLPKSVAVVIQEEMQKLSGIEPTSSEFNVSRNYLDWLTSIPWNQTTQEIFDLDKAQVTLDMDHYGLKDVKERILEFIAVNKLRDGKAKGKILCFSGPPGVGKTSIAKSIAKALNRKYFRFSVGGMHDVAEIKGHRRTYVGAMPGKMVQALKKTKSENPLVLIDEIDKVKSDAASAMLELLDPEQNQNFLDHYLDVPLDLSKVLFLCTANVIDQIPAPLLDRMEVINLSGYVQEEKLMIAKNYLVPNTLKEAGLETEISDEVLNKIIRNYCRESGVRNLKQHIEKLVRKLAVFKVKNKETTSDLNLLLGPPVFPDSKVTQNPPGVVTGLAWTSMGGTELSIECIRDLSDKGVMFTGSLGDVMKESMNLAITYTKCFLKKLDPKNDFLNSKIHIHVPEGATPKDGPSAGITIATSILSLALDKPVSSSIAMTGELTLSGKVLRIGGLREKIIAAKRCGVSTVVFPSGNKSDWVELPDYIKEGINPIFAETYNDVFKVCF